MSTLALSVTVNTRLPKRVFSQCMKLARKNFIAGLQFLTVGSALWYLQFRLQGAEVSHGLRAYLLLLSPLQGTVLGEIGLFIYWGWRLRHEGVSLRAALTCGNLQKIPHMMLEWGLFAVLLQVLSWKAATWTTAGSVGTASFVATTWWSSRLPQLTSLLVGMVAAAILATERPKKRKREAERVRSG